MFKRVERKRKRREEDEELGLDQDMKGMIGLNDTDSDESDSDLERESAQLDDSDAGIGEDLGQEEDAASEDEDVDNGPPISVAEALKDPIYLVSFDPTIHGCVLCKGKLIKNTGMATAHNNANAHKRRLEHFRLLSTDVDPRSSAWELVKAIRSTTNVQEAGLRELSKRALKRQVKQVTLRDKRKRHKELKAKAISRKASKKLSTVDETRPAPSAANLRSSAESRVQPGKTRKKKKLESHTTTSTITESGDLSAISASPMKASSDNKKLAHKSKIKSTRKTNKLS